MHSFGLRFTLVFLICSICFHAEAKKGAPYKAPKRTINESATKPAASLPASAPASRSVVTGIARPIASETDELLLYKYQLNFLMGLNVINKRYGVVSGAQLGLLISKTKPIYLGPEITLSLYDPGNLITPLLGIWYMISVPDTTKVYFVLGALAGASIPSQFASIPAATLAGYLEFIVSQEVSDIASIRGQFRPGWVGNRFAFMANLNISFRFR